MNHVLAHQGGWDELILVAVPLLILALLLAVAGVRARRIASEAAASSPDDETTPET